LGLWVASSLKRNKPTPNPHIAEDTDDDGVKKFGKMKYFHNFYKQNILNKTSTVCGSGKSRKNREMLKNIFRVHTA